MKRLPLSLLFIAAIAGCFAACSSSSSDSGTASGGSAGNGAASAAGGEAGAAAGGSSANSRGGANVATGGDSALGGDGAGASAATSGADESGGAAGETSGTSGSGGSPAGGLSSGGSAGSGVGGTSAGTGGTGGGAAGGTGGGAAGGAGGCGPAQYTSFATGLVAYFLANVAKHDCLPSQTEGSGAAAVGECATNGCNGSVGCASNFVWHDAAYDGGKGHFAVQVDITSSVTLTLSQSLGGATCTLSEQDSDAVIAATVIALDTGASLKAQLNALTFHHGSVSASGCGSVANVAGLTSNTMDALLTQAAEDAVTTLNTYQVACAP